MKQGGDVLFQLIDYALLIFIILNVLISITATICTILCIVNISDVVNWIVYMASEHLFISFGIFILLCLFIDGILILVMKLIEPVGSPLLAVSVLLNDIYLLIYSSLFFIIVTLSTAA